MFKDGVGSFGGCSELGDEPVSGDGVGSQAVALDRVADADACTLVALVGEGLQAVRGGWVEGREDMVAGGGDVVC